MERRDNISLRAGAMVPHFDVQTLAGPRFAYQSIWQHQNLVLVVVTGEPWERDYVARLMSRLPEFEARNCVCIATAGTIPGLDAPSVLIADRWGEIVVVASAPSALPTPDAVLEWVDHLQQRCPECEGEAR